MVTTPQDVALLDVRKALAMFRKLNVPILGVVENMSYFVAPDTGARYAIFGEGGGARVAEEFGIPLLGQVPARDGDAQGRRRRSAHRGRATALRPGPGVPRHRPGRPRPAWTPSPG